MMSASSKFTIVVAVDYSDTCALALERAFAMAAEKGTAEVHAINVLPAYPSAMTQSVVTAFGDAEPFFNLAAEQLKSYVAEKATAFSSLHPELDLTSTRIVAHQRLIAPAEQVAQLAADLEADLVIVGTHGRRGVSRLILGSVAEGIVRLSPCPVLVMRPKALPTVAPAIEPPCPRCVEARKASGGEEMWCAQHRERHGQRHTYTQGDRVGAETNMPLVVRN
jgi:nucleotide-binding universal stress UspA family protein